MRRFGIACCSLLMVAAAVASWFGIAYFVCEVLPDGWTDEWYGPPTMMVVALSVVLSIGAFSCGGAILQGAFDKRKQD